MSQRLPWRRWTAALVMALSLALGAEATGADDFSLRPVASRGELVAGQLTRMALQTLVGDPQPHQFARAQILLDLAIQLCPDDGELLRLRAELAQRTGDQSTRRRMLERYCRLAPEDDAVQLALIMASLDARQTLAQRTGAVRRLLDDDGASQFTDALRSRLFSYLASAAREVGDDEQTLAWIKRAVSLDQSNKEAAALALEVVVSRKAPPLAVGTALLLLIRADPLDAQSRLALAQLMLSQGAYADAAGQYEVAERLGAAPDVRMVHDWALSLAAAGRTEEALTLLDAGGAFSAPAEQDPAETDGDRTLAPELELLRLAVLREASMADRAARSLDRLVKYPKQRADTDPEAAAYLVWLLAFADAQPQVSDGLAPGLLKRADGDPLTNRALGWRCLRRGELGKARQRLGATAEVDQWAMYGLALAAEQDRPNKRLGLLRRAYETNPGTVAGVLARLELAKRDTPPKPLPAGTRLAASLAKWKDMLRRPDSALRPWCLVDIEVGPVSRFGYLDPITATVRIRNATDMPLAIGPGQAIPSPLVVRTSVRVAGAPIEDPRSIVVDVRRRLRLGPRKAIELTVRLDRGELGAVLAHVPTERFSFSVTALLDPTTARDGAVTAGPRGAADTKRLIERRGLSATEANVTGWLDDIGQPQPSTAKLRSIVRLVRVAGDLAKPELRSQVAEKVNNAFPTLDRLGQALLVSLTPADDQSQELWPVIHAQAAASDDPLVRICYLAQHVQDADSPHIQAAADSGNPAVADFARALAESLRQE